jgi:hypothetical protein
MIPLTALHSPHGAGDFLGLRRARRGGGIEIVYDDGVACRLVWRVTGRADPEPLGQALRAALDANRVVPALYAELKKRAIAIEAVERL